MEKPSSFKDAKFLNYVCKLQKSIYGLKQAPQAWFNKLTTYLQSLRFIGSKTNTSLFFKCVLHDLIFILIYVDDNLIISPNSSEIQTLLQLLQMNFAICDLKLATFSLGIKLIPHKLGFVLSYSKYIASLLSEANIEKNCKPLFSPCVLSSTKSNTSSQVDDSKYQSILGLYNI